MKVDTIPTEDELVSRIREYLETASHEVLIAVEPERYRLIEDHLETCYQNGTFIALCLYTDPETAKDEYDFSTTATLARAWDQELDTMMTIDQGKGVIGMPAQGDDGMIGLSFETEMLYGMAFMQFMSQQWDEGAEVYVTPARDLPYECANLRDAALNAALHLREENRVGFSAEVREAPAVEGDTWEPLEGQLSTVRQSFVDPSTNNFFGEIGLVGYVEGEGRISMGGHGAFFEDYEARNIVLQKPS